MVGDGRSPDGKQISWSGQFGTEWAGYYYRNLQSSISTLEKVILDTLSKQHHEILLKVDTANKLLQTK